MRILILSPYLPYAGVDHAGGAFVFKLIQALSQRHQLHLLCFTRSREEQGYIPTLDPYCVSIDSMVNERTKAPEKIEWQLAARTRNLLSPQPYRVSNFGSARMKGKIVETLNQICFDIVQVEFISMGQYVHLLDHSRTLLDEHDFNSIPYYNRFRNESHPLKKTYFYIQWLKMRRFEPRTCKRFSRILVRSDYDKKALLELNPQLKVHVIPHGCEIGPITDRGQPKSDKVLLFVGAMWRPENVEMVQYFYQHIFPVVRQEIPDVLFQIVGSSPQESIQRIADQDANVEVTGAVDDLTPYYADSTVCVAPVLVGGGMIIKVLDALAMGKPVVTTSLGNRGIGAISGRELLVADTPEEFSRLTLELLHDPTRRRELGQNARRFAQSRYSWERVIDRLEGVYSELMDSASGVMSN